MNFSITSLITSVKSWLVNQVFVAETLVELALIIFAAVIAFALAPRLNRLILASRDRFIYPPIQRLLQSLHDVVFPLIWLFVQWLIALVANQMQFQQQLMVVTTSLLSAWVVIKLASSVALGPLWAKTIAWIAWIVAALNIVGILDDVSLILDQAAFSVGEVQLSALTIVEGLFTLAILLWLSGLLIQILDSRIQASTNLSPSVQVLSSKLLHIGLIGGAFFIALAVIGVDLTALAVFGGAIGVGLGFGLQKIFANLISGFILLVEKSIKPGDVIAVSGYYGRVDSLGARYVSVYTRDGIEWLIPNEDLITTRVENWSFSQNLIRLKKSVGVHYKSDIHKAIDLCLEAAAETDRILADPAPVCHLMGFGDSSVDLEVRFWINDPMNGRANVTSALLLRVWDKFHEHGIEIPYPQRDLHLRSTSIPAGSFSVPE